MFVPTSLNKSLLEVGKPPLLGSKPPCTLIVIGVTRVVVVVHTVSGCFSAKVRGILNHFLYSSKGVGTSG